MSGLGLEHPLYESGYYSQPVILDSEGVESPDTTTIRVMSAYKPQLQGFVDTYGNYPHQTFPQQDATSHMNQLAFVANQAATRLPYRPPPVLTLQSLSPQQGLAGSKVFVRILSAYDLYTLTSSNLYASVFFGNLRCPAHITKESQATDGSCLYSLATEAPALDMAPYPVTLAVSFTSDDGREVGRLDIAESFTILACDHSPDSSPASPPSLTMRTSSTTSPVYEYASAPSQHTPQHSDDAVMLHAYRTSNHRSRYDNGHRQHRPPALVRTTTLSQGSNTYSVYTSKAVLNIQGDLNSMARGWSTEESQNRRRIVMFKKSQNGSRLDTSFKPVPVNERPPQSICVSCIYWAERGECYVTSVDIIHLLEQLVVAPNRFTTEEKNRIRRNLEGFKPSTVSKSKVDYEEFFKIIMNFGNPKPRHIEKDVKVFPWKILGPALSKIISKYSTSPSAMGMPPTEITRQAPLPPVWHNNGQQSRWDYNMEQWNRRV